MYQTVCSVSKDAGRVRLSGWAQSDYRGPSNLRPVPLWSKGGVTTPGSVCWSMANFAGGGRGPEPRTVGGLLKLEEAGDGAVPELPERKAALLTH